jgi:alpha-ribazole phosphatase
MEQLKNLIFVRHAETNMAGTFCGHSDPELNAQGYAQLKEIVNDLRREDVRNVYSSDLRRAKITGDSIADAFAIECRAKPELREISFGEWEGLTWDQIERKNSSYAQRWLIKYPALAAPAGEPFCHFERRVLREIKHLTARTSEGCAVVVTHAGVLRVILQTLCGCTEASAWEQTRSYGSIIRYRPLDSASGQAIEVRT